MSQTLKTNGLVIRETAVGESDKILTLLTPELGKISVYYPAAKNIRSEKPALSKTFLI